MEEYNFFAFINRMKYIIRWGLMKNTEKESLKEHSFDVAVISHGLCLIGNIYFKKDYDLTKVLSYAMYHDGGEIITGDLPTPVKYLDKEISGKYKEIEKLATKKLLNQLPKEMKTEYENIFFDNDDATKKIVKAADKLSALIKCAQELSAGNKDFESAYESTLKSVKEMKMEEVDFFLKHFLPPFEKNLDQITF